MSVQYKGRLHRCSVGWEIVIVVIVKQYRICNASHCCRPIWQTSALIFSASTALRILTFLLWNTLVHIIDQTKFGLCWCYFRNFNANWENRPNIFGRKAENRVYFPFAAEFRYKTAFPVFYGYWEILRNNWRLKWSYFGGNNWHFQLNLVHSLARGVENLSLFPFFSRCDDGKAKKIKLDIKEF